jgi:hypothetical protein
MELISKIQQKSIPLVSLDTTDWTGLDWIVLDWTGLNALDDRTAKSI